MCCGLTEQSLAAHLLQHLKTQNLPLPRWRKDLVVI